MRINIKDSPSRFRAITHLKSLNPEKKWTVEVKEYRRDRSAAQNRLYWSWVKIIGDTLGYDKYDMHVTLALEFLNTKQSIHPITKEMVTVPTSTTTLDTKEFTDYLERIDRWAAEYRNIQLPHPDDYDEAMGVRR